MNYVAIKVVTYCMHFRVISYVSFPMIQKLEATEQNKFQYGF